LAGVNRPENEEEYIEGNVGFLQLLLDKLKQCKNTCPIMYASSIQAALDIPYGISKRLGEKRLLDYAKDTGAKVLIYRFPNVFGKWCRPNYNSVVATFCYNMSHDLPIKIHNPETELCFIHIDDLTEEMLHALLGEEHRKGSYCEVPISYSIILSKLESLLNSFRDSRTTLLLPDMSDEFTKKLYSTWLTYLPEQALSYELFMHKDDRGSFTEFIRQSGLGQVSVNIAKPGIRKGNHWHSLKHEKFLVVSGQGVIRLRKINSQKVMEYNVSQQKMEVIDIPAGYVHNIENTGITDLVTIIWANEEFNEKKPDTYYAEV
jgi:UDP-2-acetamido-2,6-beta-L-arabino-hexul-4-ose reductase